MIEVLPYVRRVFPGSIRPETEGEVGVGRFNERPGVWSGNVYRRHEKGRSF